MAGASKTVSPAGAVLLAGAGVLLVLLFRLDYLWLEALLAAAVLTASRFLPFCSAKPPAWCSGLRVFSRRHPGLSCAIPAVSSALFRIALLPWIPAPHPVVPDEFSHVLLAKTFLAGRLANPAHPLWHHFESIHLLSQPTYSSMYLAGQASFLALGKLLTGNLFGGVLLGTLLFCGALTWFLQAYVPPGWALYGGMLAAVRIGFASYWNNSYWGGSVPAFGAALALGAFPRLVATWRPIPAIAFTCGAIILANTRPYEGLGLLAVLGVAIVYRAFQCRKAIPFTRPASGLAISALLVCGAVWGMTRHWQAVTGNPLTMPYQLNQKAYGWPMTLPWFEPRLIRYDNQQLAQYRDFELSEHDLITKPSRIPLGILLKAGFLWRFYCGVILSAALLFTGAILRAGRHRLIWIAGGVVLFEVMIAQTGSPHYLSPAAPIVILFFVQGLRHLMQTPGRALVTALIPALALLIVFQTARRPANPDPVEPNYQSWCCSDARARDREWVEKRLAAEPGRKLVLMSYHLPMYDTFEWVYNEPAIDEANVVFARDLGPVANEELLRYYRGRDVWRIDVTPGKARLSHLLLGTAMASTAGHK